MQASTDLYLRAIEMLEDEGRGSSALDAFRQATGGGVKQHKVFKHPWHACILMWYGSYARFIVQLVHTNTSWHIAHHPTQQITGGQ